MYRINNIKIILIIIYSWVKLQFVPTKIFQHISLNVLPYLGFIYAKFKEDNIDVIIFKSDYSLSNLIKVLKIQLMSLITLWLLLK